MAEQTHAPDSRGLLGAVRNKVRLMLYANDVFGTLGRGGRMLLSGQFTRFANKLLRPRQPGAALSAYNRPEAVVRTGPPIHLAGHIHGHGGYDHVVLKALVGLTRAGVHVFRDPRSFMDRHFVPPEFAPSERMY
ncbi:MAG: hypothetical protein K2V38_13370, partial [Gemmataceae bacterium]|nr:hypothetical protein [Gemmataceae bacterium]